jgi:hypothetical protein
MISSLMFDAFGFGLRFVTSLVKAIPSTACFKTLSSDMTLFRFESEMRLHRLMIRFDTSRDAAQKGSETTPIAANVADGRAAPPCRQRRQPE